MRFSLKIFISFFVTTLILGSGLIWIGYRYIRNQSEKEFVNRYQVFSKVMGDTLTRLDKNTEALMLNAVKVLAARDATEGVLSTDALMAMKSELSMTHMFVVDKSGAFIRSTNEDPKLIPNAYSFCPSYRDMIRGKLDIAATPIIHPNPEPKPYKFLFIPSHDRQRLLEVGVRVDFVAKTLSETLGSDKNIVSMALYSPKGDPFGRFSADGVEFKQTHFDLPESFPSLRDSGDNLHFYSKVTSSHPQCCQCDVSGTSKDGEYYYVLDTEVSKSELAALQAKTKNVFIGLALGNLILAFFISRFASRRLVRKLERATGKVRQIAEAGSLNDRIGLKGTDEVAYLTNEFDRLLDSLEESQKKVIEAETVKAKIQMAKEIAHNINSPVVAIEMMLPMTTTLPDRIRKVFQDSVKEIRALAERLSRQADTLETKTSTIPPASESINLLEFLAKVISEKRIEYSNRPEIRIEFSDHISEEPIVKADQTELRAILSNLINNAVDSYGLAGGTVHAQVSCSKNDCEISISDQGKGIPPEVLNTLGKKAVTYGKKNGRGIGVFHAYRVIESWGGKIEVTSREGFGSSFRIRLPKFDLHIVPTIESQF